MTTSVTPTQDLPPLIEDLFIPNIDIQNEALQKFVDSVYALPTQYFAKGKSVQESVLLQYLDFYITDRDTLEAVAPFSQYMNYIHELGNMEPVQSRIIMSMYNLENDELLDTLKSVGYYKAEYVIHEHDASSLHWDLRIQLPNYKTDRGETIPSKYAWSWAIPKHKIPAPKEKVLALLQPLHSITWVRLGSTTITERYGKGTIRTITRGNVWVLPKKKTTWLYFDDTNNEMIRGMFVLVNTRNNSWLWMRTDQLARDRDSDVADKIVRGETIK